MFLRRSTFIETIGRRVSTKPLTNNDIQPFIYNRNPRNLEKLRIDLKPSGYSLENVNVEFWHKLKVLRKAHCVVAQLVHNTKKVVVTASTDEWGIYQQLTSKKDKMAYIVLAKVFAERCMESGIYSFACDISPNDKDTNVQVFLKILMDEDLSLSEMPHFDIHNIWYGKKEKKPWTVLED